MVELSIDERLDEGVKALARAYQIILAYNATTGQVQESLLEDWNTIYERLGKLFDVPCERFSGRLGDLSGWDGGPGPPDPKLIRARLLMLLV